MKAIFHDMKHTYMDDYVDDIVVKSKTRSNHIEVLRLVFERLRKDQFRLNPTKSALCE